MFNMTDLLFFLPIARVVGLERAGRSNCVIDAGGVSSW
jgi:hypothetical protein